MLVKLTLVVINSIDGKETSINGLRIRNLFYLKHVCDYFI